MARWGCGVRRTGLALFFRLLNRGESGGPNCGRACAVAGLVYGLNQLSFCAASLNCGLRRGLHRRAAVRQRWANEPAAVGRR